MFASLELCHRIEAAEANLTAAMADRARRAGARDVVCERLGGGTAVFVRPGAPMNKLIGAGLHGPLDASRLEALERTFAARGAPLQVELATVAPAEVAQQLGGRGYRLVAFENVLGCDPRTFATPPTPHVVAAANAVPLAPWLATMVDGFLAADGTGAGSADAFARDELERALREMASLPGLRRYAVRDGASCVGGASMRLDGGIAQLCGAATLPTHRRRGVQTALLAARLADAAAYGSDTAVITAQPGSRSQQNAQRQGFALLYARAVLVKATG